jgi:hypothetical protein
MTEALRKLASATRFYEDQDYELALTFAREALDAAYGLAADPAGGCPERLLATIRSSDRADLSADERNQVLRVIARMFTSEGSRPNAEPADVAAAIALAAVSVRHHGAGTGLGYNRHTQMQKRPKGR